jgi:hypothetical protein
MSPPALPAADRGSGAENRGAPQRARSGSDIFSARAAEAEDGWALLTMIEHRWFAARAVIARRRSDSRVAVGVVAVAPLLSATSAKR